jgi:integral membrane sensor domain MASE1
MTQAAIGGAALHRTTGYPAPFDDAHHILAFLLLAPIFCLTSATMPLSGLWALGLLELSALRMNWTTWWLGDTLGVVIALPLMLVLADESRNALVAFSGSFHRRRTPERRRGR